MLNIQKENFLLSGYYIPVLHILLPPFFFTSCLLPFFLSTQVLTTKIDIISVMG